MHHLRGIVAVSLIGLVAAGCVRGEVLTLTAEEGDLTPCEPGLSIPVETLDTEARPACDPLESTLVFPDDARLYMDTGVGGGSMTSSESRFSHGFYNVGIYGVVASRYDDDCQPLEVWGRAEAIEKLHEAFGDDLGNC